MSTSVGSIHYDLSLNKDKFDSAANQVADKIANVGKRITQFATVTSVAFAGFAVKSAASFEQTRIGLENMLGSADNARSLLKDISKFAAETPFEFPELASATKQLIAFGFSAEDAFKTMKNLGDVSAAIGAPMEDLAYLMGTLKTQGRAFTIDIRQFAQRGIPIYEYLAKVLKTNEKEITKMIEAGKIGFPEVEKAFQAMTAEGGKFHGTMAKQSKSLSGLFSTLKDSIGQTARQLIGLSETGDVIEGSLFDKIRNGVANLISILPQLITGMGTAFSNIKDAVMSVATPIAEYLQPKLQALWDTIANKLIPVISDFWHNYLEPLMPIIGGALVTSLGLAIDAVNLLLNVFSGLMTFINDNVAVVGLLSAAFGLLALKMNFGAIVSAFKGAMATASAAMSATAGVAGSLNAALTGFTGFAVVGLAAGAAVVQIVRVFGALNDIKRLNDEISKQMSAHGSGTTAFYKSLQAGVAAGRFSQEEANRRMRDYNANFQSFPARAMGGPVSANQPYIVGEEGPEMFIPNSSGKIVPNNALGGGNMSNYIYGDINIADKSTADYFFSKLSRNQELSMRGLSSMAGTVG